MRRMSNDAARYLTVRLEHATVRRGARAVLRDVSWTLRPGERWLLAGANGAGKTQLLKVVAGIVWPAPAPRPVLRYRLGRHEAVTPYGIKDEIAYLGAERQDKYERYGWDVSAARIVGTGLYRTDVPLDALSAADARRVRRALRALGIVHLAQRLFLSLSYGERRVVLLARALASRPRLLLLDEVLNGLDEANRQRILAWLASRRRRLPWVFATHDAADVPAATTHALLLQHGRVAYAGSLRRAPLARWLGQRRAHPGRGLRGAPTRGRRLVRLANARVYLDARRVLNGLSLSVHGGEWWLVHGPNGSGKTTLLRTLYGDHGVAVGGAIERAAQSPGVPLEDFKKRVGLVAPHLQSDQPRQLTVAQVVQSGRHASIGLNAATSAADRAAARRALARLGLSRLASRRLAQLSYGQARRVLFARALVRDPQLLLLDEPFAGLDLPTRRALRRRLRALATGQLAVVVTAHRPQEWRACATHELELAAGQARYCGPLRHSRQAHR
jgi:molybdate transport system ATP-binding protein